MSTLQLTEQDISEMERAERAAEAGPWDTDTSVYVVTSQESDIASVNHPSDARFIARARAFVPRAIADLRRLRAENERLEAACRDLAEVAIMRESVATQTAREADFQRISAALTAATERAERAERERDAGVLTAEDRDALAWVRYWLVSNAPERGSDIVSTKRALDVIDKLTKHGD